MKYPRGPFVKFAHGDGDTQAAEKASCNQGNEEHGIEFRLPTRYEKNSPNNPMFSGSPNNGFYEQLSLAAYKGRFQLGGGSSDVVLQPVITRVGDGCAAGNGGSAPKRCCWTG
jgi:hypothetical protein